MQAVLTSQAAMVARGRASAEPHDRDLVARAQKGDHDSFGELVQRYQARIFHLALRVLRDEEKARDAVQEAFLKAYTSLSRFEGRSGFYTWLYRLSLNHCLDLRRRDRSDRHVEWHEERLSEQHDAEASKGLAPTPRAGGPMVELERSELRKYISEAIETLPDGPRETLILREIEGLSYAEIATALEIPKGTVMSRLHYARRRMQSALAELGFHPTRSHSDKT